MIELSDYLLFIALDIALYAVLAFHLSASHRKLFPTAVYAAHLLCAIMTIAVFTLVYSFLTHDFTIKFVADTSSRDLSPLYRITALLVSRKGYFLICGWILSVFSSIIINLKTKDVRLTSPVFSALAAVIFLFLIYLNFFDLPFEKLALVTSEGKGLKLEFQDVWLTVFLIFLYVSYAGFAVVYAYALSILLGRGVFHASYVSSLKKWFLFAWGLLTIAILLRFRWAQTRPWWTGYTNAYFFKNIPLLVWMVGGIYIYMMQRIQNVLWNAVVITSVFILTFLDIRINRIYVFPAAPYGEKFLTGLIGVSIICVIAAYFVKKRGADDSVDLWNGQKWKQPGKIPFSIIYSGISILFVSIAVSQYDYTDYFYLKTGESASLKGYTITYKGMLFNSEDNRFTINANLIVTDKNGFSVTLNPGEEIYRDQENKYRRKSRNKTAMISYLKNDLYTDIRKYNEDRSVFIKISIRPLVCLLWIGGFVICTGVLMALFQRTEGSGQQQL